MRVLVCGSRTWDDLFIVGAVLDGLLEQALCNFDYPLTIITGGALGADACARRFFGGKLADHTYAEHEHVFHETYPANWHEHGKAAGPIRNQQMLDEGKPEIVVAFSDLPVTTGTSDMVKRAKRAGLPTYVVSHA